MYNILICDDEKDIVSALRIYLDSENYNIFEAYTGQEAIEKVHQNDIHLILIDIMMPVMDGISVARDARKVDDYIIIIFITNMAQYAIHGYEVNALDYVIKPIAYYPFSVKLRRAIRMIRETSGNSLLLPFDGEDRRIPTKDILYVEVHSHTI